ncbi:MAG: hypothetical protein ACU0BF_09150 [Paracoccaceae bacterium]
MTVFELGPSAFVAASHIALVMAVLMVFAELLHASAHPGIASRLSVRYALFAMLSAVVVERLYYVAARLLAPRGFDLWGDHPAPETLSALVAASVFAFAASLMAATAPTGRRALRLVATHGAGLLAIWAGIAVLLH